MYILILNKPYEPKKIVYVAPNLINLVDGLVKHKTVVGLDIESLNDLHNIVYEHGSQAVVEINRHLTTAYIKYIKEYNWLG